MFASWRKRSKGWTETGNRKEARKKMIGEPDQPPLAINFLRDRGRGLLALVFRKSRARVRYWLWLSASFKFFVPFPLLMSLGSHLAWDRRRAKDRCARRRVRGGDVTQPFTVFGPLRLSQPPRASQQLDRSRDVRHLACGSWRSAGTDADYGSRIRAAGRGKRAVLDDSVAGGGSLHARNAGAWRFRPVAARPAFAGRHHGTFDPGSMDAVLAHELCHVRRRDNLTGVDSHGRRGNVLVPSPGLVDRRTPA